MCFDEVLYLDTTVMALSHLFYFNPHFARRLFRLKCVFSEMYKTLPGAELFDSAGERIQISRNLVTILTELSQ